MFARIITYHLIFTLSACPIYCLANSGGDSCCSPTSNIKLKTVKSRASSFVSTSSANLAQSTSSPVSKCCCKCKTSQPSKPNNTGQPESTKARNSDASENNCVDESTNCPTESEPKEHAPCRACRGICGGAVLTTKFVIESDTHSLTVFIPSLTQKTTCTFCSPRTDSQFPPDSKNFGRMLRTQYMSFLC